MRAPPVRWDILAEHLDQGATAYERFEDALVDANHTLDEVAERSEASLLAHLDALVTAGPDAAARLLGPILADPAGAEPDALTIAASVAFLTGRWALLQDALWAGATQLRRSIVRACALFADAQFEEWIARAHAQSTPAYRTVLLELAAARRLPLSSVAVSLQSDLPEELAAAAQAARFCDHRSDHAAIESLLEHDARSVREAAMITALYWGSKRALEQCRTLASSERSCTPQTLRLLALLGAPHDHGYVAQAMDWPSMRPHAIRSLGFTGNLTAVEQLLPLLEADDRNEARLASEALALITGIDLSDDTLVQEFDVDEGDDDRDDSEDSDVTPGVDVPVLEPNATWAWWTQNQGRLDARSRNCRGQSDLPAAMLRLLADGRMRDRGDIALSLAIRTGGRASVDCRLLTARQREQIAACSGLSAADLCVRHSSW